MRIGITSNGYPNQRNINYKTSNRYVSINFLNLNAYLNKLAKWLAKRMKKDISKFSDFSSYRGVAFHFLFYDVAHFFNTISFSKQRWVTTFETSVPFFRKEIEEYLYADMNISAITNRQIIENGLKACASDSCKALIPISKCANDIELKLISNFPQYEDKIKSKLIQLYPPQKLYVSFFEEKHIPLDSKLIFMFVGREFYRKAGLEMLRCFEKLAKVYDIELIIVSTLNNDIPDIISIEDEIEAKTIIENNNGKWLRYFSELENEKVIKLMKTSHIGLLPTYSETFGYSVLEFQACGCPVISTDVRALPEINNNDIGWIIPTGYKNQYGEISNLKEFLVAKQIEHYLEKIIINIFKSKESIVFKANKCIDQIRIQHSPEIYNQKIASIYLK